MIRHSIGRLFILLFLIVHLLFDAAQSENYRCCADHSSDKRTQSNKIQIVKIIRSVEETTMFGNEKRVSVQLKRKN